MSNCVRCGRCCNFIKKLGCGAEIPVICRFLYYDTLGQATCRVYEDRPISCRNYECTKSILPKSIRMVEKRGSFDKNLDMDTAKTE